jgi:hypothetical protein
MILATGKFIVTQDNTTGKYGIEFEEEAADSMTVIKSVNSKIFLCGDAKFYMQVLGRENSAPHWWVWCNINVRQFNFVDYPSTQLWTHESMNAHLAKGQTGAKMLGIYAKPLFTFCEIDNILPNVLHEKINTGNDLIGCIRAYTDERIEMITREEDLARTDLLAASIAHDECKDSIEEYSFAIRANTFTITDLRATKKERTVTQDEQDDLDACKLEAKTLQAEYDHYVGHILPYATRAKTEKKKAFSALWKQKRASDFQVWNHIDNNIFQKYAMRTQAYHGGYKFSGVDIGKFLSNADEIVAEIETYLIGLDHGIRDATNDSISLFLDYIKRAAHMLDIMFAILRKAHGTVEEKDFDAYERAAQELVTLWKTLGLHYTPSFHYIHKEALRLLCLHGGFADLVEDHIEQSHQNMDRIHQRLGRLGFGAKRAMAISRLEQMSKNMTLKEQVYQVKENSKRKRKVPSKGETNAAAKTKVKTESRERNLNVEEATHKDPYLKLSGHEEAKKEAKQKL